MIRLIVLLVLVSIVLAVRFLPAWAVVLYILALGSLPVVFSKWMGERLVKMFFKVPFKMKGAVLRGATAVVHSVESIAPATSANGDAQPAPEAGSPPLDYYLVDVTIRPRLPTGRFKHWEPGELMLVSRDAKADLDGDVDSSTGGVEVFQDGNFGPDEGYKYFGEQRLRASFGIPQ